MGGTAGAAAPEELIQGLITALNQKFDVDLAEDGGARETVTFKLPRVLTA